jgi:NADPH2:quinone reductase
MKAIGSTRPLDVQNPGCLLDLELPQPQALGRDLLVAVSAIAVNPVDFKVRAGRTPPPGQPLILGWDAAGTVVATGSDAQLFQPGDQVYFAGSLKRAGANSELCLVDERIVGRKPKNLDFGAAAALPLTTLTAYEALFDRLRIARGGGQGQSLLIVGGAGGVGSIAIQLAKALTGLTVIATASRQESQAWARELGADHLLDHSQPLAPQLAAQGLAPPSYALCTADTEPYFDALVDAVAPQAALCFIVTPKAPLDMVQAHLKSLTLTWELMFTRSSLQTADMAEQHRLLDEVAALVEAGRIKSTLTRRLSPISAANLRTAHALLEGGHTIGKVVLEGWPTAARESE